MIKVYYAEDASFWEESILFAHMEQIEEKRRRACERMKSSRDRARSLGAGLLLHYALCEYLQLPGEDTPPFQTGRGQWGKPYLTEYPQVHFNLSHSGHYVCCAVGEQETGVDIQEHRSWRKGVAGRFFTAEDNRLLNSLPDDRAGELFFRIFSIRESYIKLTGRGISQGLASFEIDWQNHAITQQKKVKAYFAEYQKLQGHSLCVCGGEFEEEPVFIPVYAYDGKILIKPKTEEEANAGIITEVNAGKGLILEDRKRVK